MRAIGTPAWIRLLGCRWCACQRRASTDGTEQSSTVDSQPRGESHFRALLGNSYEPWTGSTS